jgi:hypothetical protein
MFGVEGTIEDEHLTVILHSMNGDKESLFSKSLSLFDCGLFPLLYQQLVFSELEGYFHKHRVRAFERKHAVFGEVLRQVDQVLSVLPSEQATSSVTNHLLTPRFNFQFKVKANERGNI